MLAKKVCVYIYILYQYITYQLSIYLYRFNCPLSNNCNLITYGNDRGSAVLAH